MRLTEEPAFIQKPVWGVKPSETSETITGAWRGVNGQRGPVNFARPAFASSLRKNSRRMLKKSSLLTCSTLAVISPSLPEFAETDSSPWDAPGPKQDRSE
jgi:hypothetical protein